MLFSRTLFVLLFFIQFSVKAELLISPTRIIFSERDRAQELVLINTGDKITTYRLEWTQKRALFGGGYTDIGNLDDPNNTTASKMLRFSPKQVTLNPGDRQIIKLALRKPRGLSDGEYRSHLLLKALPAPSKPKPAGVMSMTLNVQMNYSLPVTVRVGELESRANFTDYTFKYDENEQAGKINVQLNRAGKHASFGNILAYWAPNSGEPKKLIARVNAYSIYPELTESQTNLIWLNEKFEPEDGELTFVYEGTGEYRGTVFDSKTFNVTKDMFDTADKS